MGVWGIFGHGGEMLEHRWCLGMGEMLKHGMCLCMEGDSHAGWQGSVMPRSGCLDPWV